MTTWFRRAPDVAFEEEQLLRAATEMVHGALERNGMSQRQLADLLEVTQTEVSQRLSGRRNLTLRSVARMMHLLGCRVRLEASPFDDGDSVVVVAREEVWSVCFRAAISPDSSAQFAALRSNLQSRQHISSARVEHRDNQIMIELHVTAADPLTATTRATAALHPATQRARVKIQRLRLDVGRPHPARPGENGAAGKTRQATRNSG
ncbi:helix-turn-helix domain-containing protein [Nocardia camponoti]|uniref:HTH cro/C1-type domain-containing protein n=1 Tax=Nocardia camponoti TaxID=1616106 RepID=A0A917QS60_9NOCA|nr:helix-turn-helix transcriptional regulator [Nocardia camponoti]GGK65174.1 hypothetical protein GCM10011591_41780 [Nocardia camponoti]